MANLRDNLVRKEPWSDLIMGNHAVARAMLETGTGVITTFPGSPVPEISDALTAIPADQRAYYFEYSTNEKVALEVAAGAALNGHLSAVFFKSVGLNVASDSLIQLSLMNLIGGMVVILGDDPGANSSQNEQDNRVYARMSYIPMLEPANPQEAYAMYKEAARLSIAHGAPVFLRLTTHVCHARQVVDFASLPDGDPDWTPRFDAANGPYVPIAKDVFPLKRRAYENLERFEAYGNDAALNHIYRVNARPGQEVQRGVISSGLPSLSILENLEANGTPINILKLGMTYPLPKKKIADFLRDHEEVLIVEELERTLEQEIKTLAWDEGISVQIHSREGIDELMGELDPARTMQLLSRVWPNRFQVSPPVVADSPTPVRLPQLCPGCGHRTAFHAIAAALSKEDITVGDIGCHTMAYMLPHRIGEVLFSMGHAVSTGSGMAIHNDSRKVVTMIGDSTLFHAGLPGIVNAAINDHNITLVVLDNGTTAMTGHQPRFGSGELGDKIPIPKLLEDLGVKFLRESDAYDEAAVTANVKAAMEHKGFAVVIARHPCMLQFTKKRRRTAPNAKLPLVAVVQDTCTHAETCIAEFGCPSFQFDADGDVHIHDDLCIRCGSCIQTCPSGAIARIKNEVPQ